MVNRSFKVTPRNQNAHAYVTAAFLAKIKSAASDLTVEERPNFVYGGIKGSFVRAANTERFFVGKKLDDKEAFKQGLKQLEDEVHPDEDPRHASVEYR